MKSKFPGSIGESEQAIKRIHEMVVPDGLTSDQAEAGFDVEAALRTSTPTLFRLFPENKYRLEDTIPWVKNPVEATLGDYTKEYEQPRTLELDFEEYVSFLKGELDFEAEIGEPLHADKPPYARDCSTPGGFQLLSEPGAPPRLADYFGDRCTPDPRSWIGPAESYTLCHTDMADNLAVEIVGTKIFRLWHVSDTDLDNLEPQDGGYFWVCRKQLSNPRLEFKLTPGMALIQPAGWIHEVAAASDVVMLVNFFAHSRRPLCLEV